MSVIIQNICKSYGAFVAVNNVSIEVRHGEFLALLGPSGSGKTTVLRIIAGLEKPDSGEIYLEGRDAQDQPVRERKIGFVFQHFALFKHLSIFENIAFGLRLKRPKLEEEEVRGKVKELLELVHLSGIEYKYPSELSGGQRQRIALARVLAIEPKYMLLDEPFGALDAKVRKELRRWLKKLHDVTGLTTIFVTHDQEEALEIADRIAVLNKGSLTQLDTPEKLWESPANLFVYDFLGEYNTFDGCFARPYETTIERAPTEHPSCFRAKICLIRTTGHFARIELESESGVVYTVEAPKSLLAQLQLALDEWVWVRPTTHKTFSDNVNLY